jgi:hypothetical protein
MVKVVATSIGYFGGILREPGTDTASFDIPEDQWKNEKRRPSWVKLAKASTSPAPEADAPEPSGDGKVDVPADWHTLPAAERKALAKAIGGQSVPNAKEADAVISAYVEADAPEPFADAPEPETLKPVRTKNEINDATGATQPDWVAPSGSAPKPVAD